MELFEVWVEGYATTGESGRAFRLEKKKGDNTLFKGSTFKDACKNALIDLKWDMKYYGEKSNSYWACRFFDNEKDAKESFG